jgi:hypothetical protein
MGERKMPILLRRGPVSGRVNALTNYRWINHGKSIRVVGSGKHDVSADYDALVLMELVDDGAEDIVGILDGAADGEALTDVERAQVRVFRERLKALVERHNARSPVEPVEDGTGGTR